MILYYTILYYNVLYRTLGTTRYSTLTAAGFRQ